MPLPWELEGFDFAFLFLFGCGSFLSQGYLGLPHFQTAFGAGRFLRRHPGKTRLHAAEGYFQSNLLSELLGAQSIETEGLIALRLSKTDARQTGRLFPVLFPSLVFGLVLLEPQPRTVPALCWRDLGLGKVPHAFPAYRRTEGRASRSQHLSVRLGTFVNRFGASGWFRVRWLPAYAPEWPAPRFLPAGPSQGVLG